MGKAKRCIKTISFESELKAKETALSLYEARDSDDRFYGVEYAVMEDENENHFVLMFVNRFDYFMAILMYKIMKTFGSSKGDLLLDMILEAQNSAKTMKIKYKTGDGKWDF